MTDNLKNSTFGGIIYFSDFCTDCKKENNNGSTIAQRIISDRKFDVECMNNIKHNLSRKGMKNHE